MDDYRKYKCKKKKHGLEFKNYNNFIIIDFVITNTKAEKKIAVECDGPTHFQNEVDEELGIYVENDEERQRILEAAGWEFYRIRYSNWISEKFDRKLILSDVIKILS